jgi:hypothetical protein
MSDPVIRWMRTGGIAGIVAVVIYSTFFFVPWPVQCGVIVATLFGLLLGVGCAGLLAFLEVEDRSVTGEIATVFGVMAGLMVMLMLIVQLASRYPAVTAAGASDALAEVLPQALDRIHFGMDVAWDMLIGAATLLYSLAALRHERLGAAYAVPGLLIAVALLVTNLMTFPFPPAGAGSVDVGPLVGLWYVVVSVRALRSIGWARTVRSGRVAPAGQARP